MNEHIIAFDRHRIYCKKRKKENDNLKEAILLNLFLEKNNYFISEKTFKILVKQDLKFLDRCFLYIKKELEKKDFLIYKEIKSVKTKKYGARHLNKLNTDFKKIRSQDKTADFYKKYVELEVIYDTELMELFPEYLNKYQKLSFFTKNVIKWYIDKHIDKIKFPNKIISKEAFFFLYNIHKDVPIQNTNEVLSLAVFISNGSKKIKRPEEYIKEFEWSSKLVKNRKYKKSELTFFKNSDRKLLLEKLEKIVDPRDFCIYLDRWRELKVLLEYNGYEKKYPTVSKAFKRLDEMDFKNWYSTKKEAFSVSYSAGIEYLKDNPGEFCNSLINLLSNNKEDADHTLNAFKSILSCCCSKDIANIISTYYRKGRFLFITNNISNKLTKILDKKIKSKI